MSRLTRNDLQRKTTAQLAALFNQVSREIADLPAGCNLDRALAKLAMIRSEQVMRPKGP